MRLDPARSIASWAVAWTAALSVTAPMAAAQSVNVASGAPGVVPLAAVRGEETCKLVTVRDGESAELVEEREREQGEKFPFLDPEMQSQLREEFQVDVRDCAIAFGIAPVVGAQAAAGGAAAGAGFGATLAGAGVATAVGVGVAAAAIGGIVAATAGPGGGGNNTIPPTTTVPSVGPE